MVGSVTTRRVPDESGDEVRRRPDEPAIVLVGPTPTRVGLDEPDKSGDDPTSRRLCWSGRRRGESDSTTPTSQATTLPQIRLSSQQDMYEQRHHDCKFGLDSSLWEEKEPLRLPSNAATLQAKAWEMMKASPKKEDT